MSDHEKPAWMADDQVEAMAWDLEVAMMKIRKDPRAALADGLAKIRATMLAEMEAWWAKMDAEMRAERDAEIAQMKAEFTKFEAELASLMATKRAAVEAKIEDRLRQLNASGATLQ